MSAPTFASAGDLQRTFDAGFALPPAEKTQNEESFLVLRMGKDAHAVRVREVNGFAAARKIVALSSPIAGLLGLAGLRGSLVPVYSLAALLGYADADGPPRWFILCGGNELLALAFANFDGYVELPRADVRAAGEDELQRRHVREVIVEEHAVRAVVSVASLIEAIRSKVTVGKARKA
jgi:chemotaxis signal transduction protein